MKAERRDTSRIPIALETILNFSNRDYQYSTTFDISLEGVFVRALPNITFDKGTVDMAIRLPVDGTRRYHRFRAQLVRRDRRGAGYAFQHMDGEAYEALLKLVFTQQSAASA